MPGAQYGTTRPLDNIAAAKARAKSALSEKNPKLTSLERAFYEAYLRHGHLPPKEV
jgi:hypothetical protein